MGNTRMARCKLCDGSGKVLLMNSWFVTDGYRRERCGICGGTGESAYLPPDVAYQRIARERVAEWGALKPPLHIAEKLAPALSQRE